MRRQLIDYYGTRWGKLPTSQEELFIHEATIDRLLWCSIYGWDMLPIFLVHETTSYSTTAVLDTRMGHGPYFPRGFPDGTCSLFSRGFFFVHETTTYSITAVLELRMGHAPYFSRP